jgi:hypothetical protein
MMYKEEDDPVFTVDGIMGTVLHILATVGIFCAFVAISLVLGWL